MGKKWYVMAGTEGTKEYVVLCRTGRGKIGVRKLNDGRYRVRVEPFGARFVPGLAELMPRVLDWKQPGDDGQKRFSKVVTLSWLSYTIDAAATAIGYVAPKHKKKLVSKKNENVPDWARGLLPS